MLKKILILLFVVYLVLSFVVPFGTTDIEKGRGIVLLSYAYILASLRVIRRFNGEGLFVNNIAFRDKNSRDKIYKVTNIVGIPLIVIGALLSIFIYKKLCLNYVYDFITLVVILILIWNTLMLVAGRIEQQKDPKLNQRPLRNRKNKGGN